MNEKIAQLCFLVPNRLLDGQLWRTTFAQRLVDFTHSRYHNPTYHHHYSHQKMERLALRK